MYHWRFVRERRRFPASNWSDGFQMQVPEGAIPLTSDRLIYKIVNEEGIKSNHNSLYNDVAVAVEYVIRSDDGIIDRTEAGAPKCWIIGDQESESEVYLFLPIAARSMHEREVATFFFDRSY